MMSSYTLRPPYLETETLEPPFKGWTQDSRCGSIPVKKGGACPLFNRLTLTVDPSCTSRYIHEQGCSIRCIDDFLSCDS